MQLSPSNCVAAKTDANFPVSFEKKRCALVKLNRGTLNPNRLKPCWPMFCFHGSFVTFVGFPVGLGTYREGHLPTGRPGPSQFPFIVQEDGTWCPHSLARPSSPARCSHAGRASERRVWLGRAPLLVTKGIARTRTLLVAVALLLVTRNYFRHRSIQPHPQRQKGARENLA